MRKIITFLPHLLLLADQPLHLDPFWHYRALLSNDHLLQHLLHPALCGGSDPDFRDNRRSLEAILHTDPCEIPKRAETVSSGPKVHGKHTGGTRVEEVSE